MLELFHHVFFFLMIVCLKYRFSNWLIPVLSIVCIAIHQVFVFFYLAPLIVILLYKAMKSSEIKVKKHYLLLLFITVITSSVAFCVFQFYKNGLMVSSPEDMSAIISTYSNVNLSTIPLKFEYFLTMKDHFQYHFLDGNGWYKFSLIFILSLIFFSPMIIFFALFWNKCIHAEKSKYLNLIYRLALLSPLSAFPAFVLTIDYGRWFSILFFTQI